MFLSSLWGRHPDRCGCSDSCSSFPQLWTRSSLRGGWGCPGWGCPDSCRRSSGFTRSVFEIMVMRQPRQQWSFGRPRRRSDHRGKDLSMSLQVRNIAYTGCLTHLTEPAGAVVHRWLSYSSSTCTQLRTRCWTRVRKEGQANTHTLSRALASTLDQDKPLYVKELRGRRTWRCRYRWVQNYNLRATSVKNKTKALKAVTWPSGLRRVGCESPQLSRGAAFLRSGCPPSFIRFIKLSG